MLQRDELFAHAIFATDWGWAGAITSKSGLQHLIMPQNSRKTVLHIIQNHQKQTESDIASIGDLPRRINNYLRGQLVFFDDKLDLSNSTPFQQKVWETTRSVPYGETRSYAWVAHKMGMPKATRAKREHMAIRRPGATILVRVMGSPRDLPFSIILIIAGSQQHGSRATMVFSRPLRCNGSKTANSIFRRARR